jgi:addiction module HigA family antidote
VTTRKHKRWRPSWVELPGETIREALAERGLTQAVAAERMGMFQSELSDVINGHRALSARVAVRLEALTGIDARVWAHLQADADVAAERAATSTEGEP